MTTEDSSQSKIQSFDRTVFPECFERILRAGRSESARCRFEGGDADLIESDEHHEGEDENLPGSSKDSISPEFHLASPV